MADLPLFRIKDHRLRRCNMVYLRCSRKVMGRYRLSCTNMNETKTETEGPRGLRVRCSASLHVHRRSPVQVTARRIPPWTVLDAGELQLKLQLSLFIRLRVLHGTNEREIGRCGSSGQVAMRWRPCSPTSATSVAVLSRCT